jgi:hypothetical protein
MLTSGLKMPDKGHALIGLALKPGQMPAGGLAVGQLVEVMLIPDSAQGRPIPLRGLTIWALLPRDSSGSEEVTLLVPRGKVLNLANYAAHGQVSLVAVGS